MFVLFTVGRFIAFHLDGGLFAPKRRAIMDAQLNKPAQPYLSPDPHDTVRHEPHRTLLVAHFMEGSFPVLFVSADKTTAKPATGSGAVISVVVAAA